MSDSEVDAYVLAQQHERLDARLRDERWTLVADEFSEALGGGTWQYVEGEN